MVSMPVPMKETLCGCTNDCGDCIYAWYCQPCHLGSIAQKTGAGDCYGTCIVATLLACFPCYHKGILQQALLRVGVTAPIGCLECCFCLPCLQCQVSREVNNRQASATMMPPMQQQQPQIIVVQAPSGQAMQ